MCQHKCETNTKNVQTCKEDAKEFQKITTTRNLYKKWESNANRITKCKTMQQEPQTKLLKFERMQSTAIVKPKQQMQPLQQCYLIP